ncbi:hypothetical protein WJX74_000399 [Apatococcus lobatus]|uniref:Uncharacterized protein n=1 Tax=Apatococcus lobatus TaxID=904363 RepID=A0AAW1Q9T2_9CHLO
MVFVDSEYLQQTVGPPLAGGCAATAAARPSDPVEHLANWLLRYVSNLEAEEQLLKESAARKQLLESKEAERAAQKAASEAAITDRDAAIEALSRRTDDVWQLWQLAVELAVKHLPIGAAYVAAVADSAAGDPAAFLKEMAPAEAAPPAEAEEEAPKEAEVEGEADAAAAEALEAAAAAPAAAKQDYSKQHLEYIVSSRNQAWIGTSGLKLQRPTTAVPAEGDDEEAVAAAAATAAASLAPTLRMLDDNKSSMHIPNVLYEPATVFLKKFPKLGAYAAFGVATPEGRLQALICADTLIPAGSGRSLMQDDRDVLEAIASSATQAVQAMYEQHAAAASEPAGLPLVKSLQQQIKDLQPTTANPAEASPPEDAVEDAGEEAAAPAAAASGQTLDELTTAAASAQERLSNAKIALEAIREVLAGCIGPAISGMKTLMLAPKATYLACQAALLVLGLPSSTITPWHRCRLLITNTTLQQLIALDTANAWDADAWEAADPFLKAVATPAAQELMPQECPESCIGSMLTLLLQQMQAVHFCADAQRAAEAARAAKQRADEEAAAKAAAEAAAAAKAAEEAAALEAAQAQEGAEPPAEETGEEAE